MRYLTPLLYIFSPIALLGVVLFSFAFDADWYATQHNTLGVYQALAEQRVREQTKNILAYLNGPAELDSQYYTQREYLHMQDVKSIIFIVQVITITAVLFVGVLLRLQYTRRERAHFYQFISRLGLWNVVLLLSVSAALYIFFEKIYLGFHYLVFRNDFWQLNPATEKLIVLFPPELFFSLALRIALYTCIIAMLIFLIPKLFKKQLS